MNATMMLNKLENFDHTFPCFNDFKDLAKRQLAAVLGDTTPGKKLKFEILRGLHLSYHPAERYPDTGATSSFFPCEDPELLVEDPENSAQQGLDNDDVEGPSTEASRALILRELGMIIGSNAPDDEDQEEDFYNDDANVDRQDNSAGAMDDTGHRIYDDEAGHHHQEEDEE